MPCPSVKGVSKALNTARGDYLRQTFPLKTDLYRHAEANYRIEIVDFLIKAYFRYVTKIKASACQMITSQMW